MHGWSCPKAARAVSAGSPSPKAGSSAVRASVLALVGLAILACTGSVEVVEPPPCADEAFTFAVDGKVDFPIDKVAHRSCAGGFALVAVHYKCAECEPFEQYFLQAEGRQWKVLSAGTGLGPDSCEAFGQRIDGEACQALWAAFFKDEKKRARQKKRRRR